ncbi:ribosomal-processing cysteine protease Prp [Enterocloster lavalensis]|uniref:ribosomal-processing cysteine protease Prp n=1 Tax=Enterocloster lavalensis TaxID=460384 RepID=UPI00206ABA88|nr:MAG TPA: YsxB-like protein [Caudoviricetes sp.]
MITVNVRENRLDVGGHAGYAPRGQSIVCSAVSALTLTLIVGLREIAGMEITEHVESGNVSVSWQKLNDTGKALIDTWFLGLCHINQDYNCIRFL